MINDDDDDDDLLLLCNLMIMKKKNDDDDDMMMMVMMMMMMFYFSAFYFEQYIHISPKCWSCQLHNLTREDAVQIAQWFILPVRELPWGHDAIVPCPNWEEDNEEEEETLFNDLSFSEIKYTTAGIYSYDDSSAVSP